MLRSYHVLFVLAGVFFFAGFALLDAGLDLRTSFQGEETFGIPAGAQWYYAVEIPFQAGGRIHIDFQETSQRAIDVLVLAEADYEAFLGATSTPLIIEETSGAAGVLALSLREAGTYYLVFTHAAGTNAVPQEVDLRYSFTGVQPDEPDWFLIGLGTGAAAVGTVLATIGARRRIRAVRQEGPEAAA
ncbi:MAG: hypothetical protein ACE5I4_00225 [Thermoplasmata archaeon]